MAMKSKLQQWREYKRVWGMWRNWGNWGQKGVRPKTKTEVAKFNQNWARHNRDDIVQAAFQRAQVRASARSLPRLMLVTDTARMQPSFDESIRAALQDGARLILVRERHIPSNPKASDLDEDQHEDQRHIYGRHGRKRTPAIKFNQDQRHTFSTAWPFGARVLLCTSIPAAYRGGFRDSIHFKWHALVAHSIRRAVSHGLMCGVSTHSIEEAQQAQEAGAHYIVLGSIFATASHPGAEPLGLQVLAEIAREIRIPIFAIGGINSRNARSCLDAGAHGVAAIRAAWEPDERRELLRVVGQA